MYIPCQGIRYPDCYHRDTVCRVSFLVGLGFMWHICTQTWHDFINDTLRTPLSSLLPPSPFHSPPTLPSVLTRFLFPFFSLELPHVTENTWHSAFWVWFVSLKMMLPSGPSTPCDQHNVLLPYGWIKLLCIRIPHSRHPFISWWMLYCPPSTLGGHRRPQWASSQQHPMVVTALHHAPLGSSLPAVLQGNSRPKCGETYVVLTPPQLLRHTPHHALIAGRDRDLSGAHYEAVIPFMITTWGG